MTHLYLDSVLSSSESLDFTAFCGKSEDSPAEYQLCFAHATHLAVVVDVIYKNQDDNNNQKLNDKDLDDDSDENLVSLLMAIRMKVKLLSVFLIFFLSSIRF